MPYKKKFYKKKKKFSKKANWMRKYNKAELISKSIVPKKAVVRMKYCDTYSLNPGVGGVPVTQLIHANHINDPDISGSGHQPYGHDQWKEFYNHYTVIGSKITVRFQSTGKEEQAMVGIGLKDDTTIDADDRSLRENGKSVYGFLSGDASDSMTTLVRKYSPRTFFGINKPLGTDSLRGTFGTTVPAGYEGAFFHVWCGAADGSTDITPVLAHVQVEYIVLMMEPKDFTIS